MEQRIESTHKQSLLFTPKMQQSIKILQLPVLQLIHRIETELCENPFLEIDEGPIEDGDIEEETHPLWEIDDEVDWNTHLEGMGEEEDASDYENTLCEKISLRDYLSSQLRLLSLNEREIRIGETIIDAIDDDGYLRSSIQSIADVCGANPEEVERILGYIQEFEPVGIGARDLSEALLIQARYLGWDEGDDIFKLINHHLSDIQSKDYIKIGRAMGLGIDDVKRLIERLKILEPKPARLYNRKENPPYISPDIIVRSVDGRFIVELNEVSVPRLKLSPYYKEILKRGDEGAVSYLKERMDSAAWFLRCIEERRKTLLSIAEEIFRRQANFLKDGPSSLQPLRMQDIADVLGINESTVSRAASNKYVQTPWGIFPLKFFFTGGLSTEWGEIVSSGQIKERIRAIIKGESPDAPLTDEEITSRLNHEGFKVSRRTVTKYRIGMGIPPSKVRRR